ncbi:hypothetical protein ACIBAG_25155 [Streptomyces sp. NPDC051243]|uniref:hypothetical protein n=1 Tax=Streptomyces sp. NPDC051243 TaxID=3365646 RepID=UPI00378A8DC1
MHRDPSWDPLPVRGTARLTCQFLLTTVYAPVHWILWAALFLVLIAFAFVIEVLSLIPGVEKGYDKLMDTVLRVVPFWPRWFVTLPELRHEGDAAFYRARLEAVLAKWSANKIQRDMDLGVRKYRAVGAGHAAQRSAEYGWALKEVRQRPTTELRLARVAAVQAPPSR